MLNNCCFRGCCCVFLGLVLVVIGLVLVMIGVAGYLVCCVAGFLLAGSLLLVFVFMFVLLFGVFRV